MQVNAKQAFGTKMSIHKVVTSCFNRKFSVKLNSVRTIVKYVSEIHYATIPWLCKIYERIDLRFS